MILEICWGGDKKGMTPFYESRSLESVTVS